MSRRMLWLIALGFGLTLAIALTLGRQRAGNALVSVNDAGWHRPDEWFNPALMRWMGVAPPQQRYLLSEVRMQPGDDLAWAKPEYDDSHWQITGFGGLPSRTGIYWARFRVRSEAGQRLPRGVLITALAAYEIYWDGERVGSSGAPGGSFGEERVGSIDNVFGISEAQAAEGEHVVALRLSTYRLGFASARTGIYFFMQAPMERLSAYLKHAIYPALAAGVFFLLSLASLVCWIFVSRRVVLVLFSAFCFDAALMQVVMGSRWFYNYPVDWHHPLSQAGTALAALLSMFLVLVVVVHHGIQRRWLVLSLAAIAMVLALVWGPQDARLQVAWTRAIALSVSCLCAVWGAWQTQRAAWLVAGGLASSVALICWRPYDYFPADFFVRFMPTVAALSVALALNVRDHERAARQAVLRAARLEIELLKKNIQPHFLMNTLTSLLEVVEQDSRAAGRMIEALASEFRVLSRVASERLIPLSEELELCRAHLQIMSLQRKRTFVLDAAGVPDEVLVPPALFHTLIENGITHQILTEARPVFRLRAEVHHELVRYVLIAPGKPERASNAAGATASGTGLRYVKARLEESFPGGWSLRSGPLAESGGWQTIIELRVNAEVVSTSA